MDLVAGTASVDAVAVSVAYQLSAGEAPHSSPYSRHEVYLLPGGRREGDEPLRFAAVVEGGGSELRLEFL